MPIVEFLASNHNRAAFDCGKESLNRYLREVARQNADRNLGVTHVVVPEVGATEIMGYFTLVTRSIEGQLVPEKRLPRGEVGVVLLGRLAVSLEHQGSGLGRRMLLRAMAETLVAARRIGIYGLVIDALDEEARSWYLRTKFGFSAFVESPNRLYLPVSIIQKIDLGDFTGEI